MKLRHTSLLALSLALFSLGAHAHEPSLHEQDRLPSAKAKPTTCAQLADTKRYSSDVTDADIKALKTKCDAEKKVAAKPSDKK